NTFWEWYGQETVSRLRLEAGAKILDVCCGSGASAIPAAKAVGPNGFVLGIDLAENLIELAKTKARERGLENTEFRVADMLDLDLGAFHVRRGHLCLRHIFCAGHAARHPDALEARATRRPAGSEYLRAPALH